MKKDFSKKINKRVHYSFFGENNKDKNKIVEVSIACKADCYNKIIHYLKSKYLLEIDRIAKEELRFETEVNLASTILYDLKFKYPIGYINGSWTEIVE